MIKPYITKTKSEVGLPNNTQNVLLVWDPLAAQSTDTFLRFLAGLNIKVVPVPKNMTYLLQPLGITANASVKTKIWRNGGSTIISRLQSPKRWKRSQKEMSPQSP